MLRAWSFEDGTEGESIMNPLILQRDNRPYPAFQGALQNKEEPACMECFRNTVVWSGVKGIACSQKGGVVWSPSSLVQKCSWNLGSGHPLLRHIAAIYLKFYHVGMSFQRVSSATPRLQTPRWAIRTNSVHL